MPEAGDATTTDPARRIFESGLLPVAGGVRLRQRVEDSTPWKVRGHEDDLNATITNLVANACEAMPGGGRIIISVSGETVAGPHPAGLRQGSYMRVSVHDNGPGISSATLDRLRKGRFTTKPRGKGTGLGLSSARDFAEHSGGTLTIDSRPGWGTCVTFWVEALA